MTLKELHDSIPGVCAENFGEIDKAEAYAQKLLEAAEDEKHRQGAREVIGNIQARKEHLAEMVRRCQGQIHQIALLAHAGQDFEPKV